MADKPLKNDGLPPSEYAQAVAVDQYGRPLQPNGAIPQPAVVIPSNSGVQRDVQGNALCKKCGSPYPLPAGCTSWR